MLFLRLLFNIDKISCVKNFFYPLLSLLDEFIRASESLFDWPNILSAYKYKYCTVYGCLNIMACDFL